MLDGGRAAPRRVGQSPSAFDVVAPPRDDGARLGDGPRSRWCHRCRGFPLDHQGWIYTSSLDSVQVFHPDGTARQDSRRGEMGNVTFGGDNWLYIAASTSLYRIRLATRGIQAP
jgi:hypothetical protein